MESWEERKKEKKNKLKIKQLVTILTMKLNQCNASQKLKERK
jgi:hypothetical protein